VVEEAGDLGLLCQGRKAESLLQVGLRVKVLDAGGLFNRREINFPLIKAIERVAEKSAIEPMQRAHSGNKVRCYGLKVMFKQYDASDQCLLTATRLLDQQVSRLKKT